MRIAEPSKMVQKKAERLCEQFYAQYDEQDDIPEDAYEKFLYKNGSRELKEYLIAVEQEREKIKREGAV